MIYKKCVELQEYLKSANYPELVACGVAGEDKLIVYTRKVVGATVDLSNFKEYDIEFKSIGEIQLM